MGADGTAVAAVSGMARRIGALLTMTLVIALALVLLWRVSVHRQEGLAAEEAPLAHLDVSSATSVENFALILS